MRIRYKKAHRGNPVGTVAEALNVGVGKTLIYLGVCEEVKPDAKKVDDNKNVSTGKPRPKPRKRKKPSANSGS
jgi:hypothetical protein